MALRRKGETSYKETVFGILGRSKLIPLEIEGIKRAWDFVLKRKRQGKMPITPAFFQEVHRVGFGWIFPEMAGKFRRIEVTVSRHKPPHTYLVHQLMKDFCEDLDVRLKNLPALDHTDFLEALTDCLAWAHHQFLWIHPFVDYNGRIGRLLISMIFLHLNLPPIELKVETKSGRWKYVKALQDADRGDNRSLKKLIQSALEEAAKELRRLRH